ncbi:MAG: beta-L-arabinofuranosidase domain-containing protein [Bacteroidales bacterium]
MNQVIPIIAQAQEDDGYIATQVTAGQFPRRWIKPDNHELINMGHLLTAASVHYRMTGKTALLEVLLTKRLLSA